MLLFRLALHEYPSLRIMILFMIQSLTTQSPPDSFPLPFAISVTISVARHSYE